MSDPALTSGTAVLCYGLGPIGLGVAELLSSRSGVAVVGAVDLDPAKVDSDLGELLDRDAMDIRVTRTPPAAPTGGVAVHATGSRLTDVAPQLEKLVEQNWNVLSTCEQLVHARSADEAVARHLDEVARRQGVTVLGAGINPGYLTDALVLALTGVCRSVRRIRVSRMVNTTARRTPLQVKAGVGLTRDEFEARARRDAIGHVGLRQSAYLVADRIGWPVDRYDERIEPVIAAAITQTGVGPIEPGRVIGQRQQARLVSGGNEVLRYDLEMSAVADDSDSIEIDGDPDVRQQIAGGVNGDVGTVAVIGNLVPVVAAAGPGLLTMADVMPLAAAATEATPVKVREGDAGA